MGAQSSSPLTQVLQATAAGDPQAAADLLPLVYSELRKLARVRLAKTPPGNTLQPTALVHEAYLRLVGRADPGWSGRGHFFAAAAQAMRQILVEQARRKASAKRGGGLNRLTISGVNLAAADTVDLLELHEALESLEAADARKAQIVTLRFFGGLSNEETAAVLDVSLPTVEREWRFARAFLFQRLQESQQI